MTFHDAPTNIPDPEVVPKAKRRKFSAEYKRRILEEANDCTEPGQIGALLRREGLYSSHLDGTHSCQGSDDQRPWQPLIT